MEKLIVLTLQGMLVKDKADKNVAVVIGASGGIGSAILRKLCLDNTYTDVIAVSRNISDVCKHSTVGDANVLSIETDYTPESVESVVEQLSLFRSNISKVIICNGVLHDQDIWPEKRLEEITADNMVSIFTANSIIPMLFLKSLISAVKGQKKCVIALLSARVSSLQDNRLGGWYSYRASKTALNMLVKTASIEYARRANNVKFILYHPGTVDTNLSRPFQSKRVKKLLDPDDVAARLLQKMSQVNLDDNLAFIDWEGYEINW